jgi:two-component system, OmpR family, sensor histidine kinase TctE
MMIFRGQPSLRLSFLFNLLLPAFALALILTVGGNLAIKRIVEATHDRLLDGSLLAIAERLAVDDGEITVDLPQVALGMLESQANDSIYYSVSVAGKAITGYNDLPLSNASGIAVGRPVHWDAEYRNKPVRIAAATRKVYGVEQPVLVAVAETKSAREQLQFRMVRDLVLGVFLLLIFIGLLSWVAVERGLRPLAELRQQVDKRGIQGPSDLRALDLEHVPKEALAPAQAINSLFERVREATEVLRRFTADASHQMRTPLAALRTHVDLLKRDMSATNAASPAFSEVQGAVSRLERLISQLLTLAKADQSSLTPLVKKPVDLVAKVAEVVSQRAPDAIKRNIDVQFVAEQPSLVASSNDILLEEMLGNVIDNSIRYGAEQGLIIVRIAGVDGRAKIEIEDDGPGIVPMERERAFERFYRIPRKDNPQGSGLGLAIVRALGKQLGAEVNLGDGKELRGLCVTISLELA